MSNVKDFLDRVLSTGLQALIGSGAGAAVVSSTHVFDYRAALAVTLSAALASVVKWLGVQAVAKSTDPTVSSILTELQFLATRVEDLASSKAAVDVTHVSGTLPQPKNFQAPPTP